jgi:hypothetical protein
MAGGGDPPAGSTGTSRRSTRSSPTARNTCRVSEGVVFIAKPSAPFLRTFESNDTELKAPRQGREAHEVGGQWRNSQRPNSAEV